MLYIRGDNLDEAMNTARALAIIRGTAVIVAHSIARPHGYILFTPGTVRRPNCVGWVDSNGKVQPACRLTDGYPLYPDGNIIPMGGPEDDPKVP